MISVLNNKMECYNKQKQEFDKFLASHKIKKEDKETIKTHTCFGFPYGSYHIPEDKYDKFINLYKKIACKEKNLHLIERHDGKNVGPLIIDIDYWVENKNKQRKYRMDHIESLVMICKKIIKKYLRVQGNELEVLVMEKEKPTYKESKGQYKDVFHLIYPIPIHIRMRYFLLNKIKEKSKKKDIFGDIPYIDEYGYDDIFDMRVIYDNGITMYGSRKEDGQTYYITQIYDHQGKQKKLCYEPDELTVLCSLRRFYDEDEIEISEEYMDNKDFLSSLEDIYNKLHLKKKERKKKENKDENVKQEKRDKHEKGDKKRISKNSETEMARKLLQTLDKKRADKFSDWINVGWALHNIDDELLDDYIEFSKQSKKWEPGCCEKKWEEAKKIEDGLTIASLHWWAQNDNPEEYKRIMKENVNQLIREAETGTHDDIAKIVLELYKHKFRCTSIQKNIWYEFNNHKWVNVDSGYTLNMKLSDEITKEYTTMAGTYLAQSSVSEGHDNENYIQKAKSAFKIVEKLKNVSFKSQVISACSHRFHEISKNFEELLDSNPNIVGFENGVFDLELGCFRPGLPDDYVSMSTKYNYKEFKESDQEIKDIDHYFNIVMIEPAMRKYVSKFISSCLDGHCRDQKFILWTGIGCHQKDTEIMMFDGTRKKVQEIKCGEKLMGDDSKPRTIKVLYTGEQDMYKIYLDNNENFTVNKNHRLALKNKYNSSIYPDTDLYDQNIYWLEWYEYLDNVPTKVRRPFISKEKANRYFETEVKRKESYIHYNEVIAVMVSDYLNLAENIKKDFVMYSRELEFTVDSNYDYYGDIIKNGYENTDATLIKNKLKNRLDYVAGLIEKYGLLDKSKYILPKNIMDNEKVDIIVRSVGFRIDIYEKEVHLSGGPIKYISEKINDQNKKIKKGIETEECAEYMIINMENIGRERFYGFEIDGDEKYLMGNLMATYNSNGKSTTQELMEKTFGEYFGVLPTTVLTRKRGSSSNATPELADKRGKRILFINEPEHDDTVYVGLMKNLTGGDWIEARALYGMPFRYKPQFKLVLVCNRLPYIPANDQGTWRRLRVTPWESKFIDGEPKKKNEFKKDKTLQERLKKWKQGFMWMLLNRYYPDYKKNGLEEPSKVTQFTDEYKKDQDVIAAYMGEEIEITGEFKDKMTLQLLYDGFKTYVKGSGTGLIPSRKEFEEYLKNMDKIKVTNGIIMGAKQKEIELDDDQDQEYEGKIKNSKSSKASVKD